MRADIVREVALEQGVSASLLGDKLAIKGPRGEVSREFVHPKIKVEVQEGKVVLKSHDASKREKTQIGTFESHIMNMVKGVQEMHVYKLKVCSGHFPMTVSVVGGAGGELVVKNFLGETVARKVALPMGVEVKVSGAEIVVSSADKELAGQAAGRIEQLCRITNRDRRIFQDGIYITAKPSKRDWVQARDRE